MRFTFTDRAAPFCELGFDDVRIQQHTAGKWDVHHWDAEDARWSGVEPTWRDISCEVWDASTEYGRGALNDRFVPGQANVLARNLSGWADPQQAGMRPGRAIRFGVDHVEFGRIVLFRGFIDAVIPTYDPAVTPSVELQCIDALGEVNRGALVPFPTIEQPPDDEPQIPLPNHGEMSHERIIRTLDRAAWPQTKRDIEPSSVRLIGDYQGGQVADILSRIADSAGGSVWGDREGNVGFRPRDWQMFDPVTPVDAVIGNVGVDDVCPGAWVRPMDRASISTKVIMGRDAETAIEVNDVVGQMLYGIESFERVDLLTLDDPYIVDLANRTLESRSHQTAPRVRAVTLDARHGDEQLDVMATADVHKPSHYRCRLREFDGRLVFDDRYIATALVHTLSASEWRLDMNLDLAAPYEAVGARWDQAGWDQGTWANLNLRSDVLSLRADLERMLA